MTDSNENKSIHLDVDAICSEMKIRPEIYIRLVTSFANSLAGKMKQLDDALSTNDNDQMRMILHEIKGTSGNLRLDNISQAEASMHTAVKSGEAQKQLLQYFGVLNTEVNRLQQYVTQFSQE